MFKSRFACMLTLILLSACGGSGSTETVEGEEVKFPDGKAVYDRACVACHMKDGKGLEGTFPPLAGSDYLLEDPVRALGIVINGIDGEMTVNGVKYESIMPPQDVTEEEGLQVTNYILNAWGNNGGEVTQKDLEKID